MIEEKEFLRLWQNCQGNVQEIAKHLGLTRQAIYSRLERLTPDVYYVIPVGQGFWKALAVNHAFGRAWLATGKMSRNTAERFVIEKRRVKVGERIIDGEIKTVRLTSTAKVVFVDEKR